MNPLIIGLLAVGALGLLSSKKASAAENVPDSKTNIPFAIAVRALAMSGADAQAQIVWLNDQGYPRTATALTNYFQDGASSSEVLAIAQEEWKSKNG